MPARITRHFATVGTRRVHYARGGSGPPVLLLHESPCSSKAMLPTQVIFAERFTTIAPDTPGNGLSDPLDAEQPEIDDFADALAALLDVLGIERAAVYGRHTGASIAFAFALRHPGRCTMLLTNGLPVYPPAQSTTRLSGYLLPLVPSWDGGHLVWLWFRFREQHVFWPWHQHTNAHRADRDVPDLAFLQRGVMELLEAGDGYRTAYAAAFRHGGTVLADLPALQVPACLAVRGGDSLSHTLPLFPPGTWTLATPRDETEAARTEAGLLALHAVGEPPGPPPDTAPLPDRVTPSMLDMGDSQILLRKAGAPGGTPLLVVHHLPGSAAAYDPLLLALGQDRPIIAPDLPGCGESLPAAAFQPGIEAWADSLLRVLDRLGLPQVDVYAHSGGCAVAVALAALCPGRVRTLLLDGPPALPPDGRDAFAAGYAPSALPDWDGSHLLRVWHHLRDQELWWPWYDRTRAAARPHEPDIDPARLTLRARDALKQPATYQPAWHAVLSYPLLERLAALPHPVAVLAAEGDLFAHLAPAAAAAARVETRPVPPDWPGRATAIAALLHP